MSGGAWCIIGIEEFDDEGRPSGHAWGIQPHGCEFHYFLFDSKETAEAFLDARGGPISRDTHATVWLDDDNVAKLNEIGFIHEGDLLRVLEVHR